MTAVSDHDHYASARRRQLRAGCRLVVLTCLSSLFELFISSACMAAAIQDSDQAEWNQVSIPAAWKEPPRGILYTQDGYAWFRCFVHIPAEWREHEIQLFVEAVDDAREIYFNGVQIGQFGTFPPEFRSGLGHDEFFSVPTRLLLADQPNVVAIRVYLNDARTNFNVAAPVLFAGDQAIRLEGAWQHRAGDHIRFSRVAETPAELALYQQLEDAATVRATLKKLTSEIGPLTPSAALTQFRTPDDLRIELALGEPDIGQPLSFKFDARGRLWVVQYLQYPNPAGLTMVSRDKFLRTVYDKIPPPPPHHFPGADKITIHEDVDGDGYFESQKTFVEGLSLVTSFAFGRGGVWVLNPPYLLFYPDRDGDDLPDSEPEVHLQGFGLEDTHSIANSLRWGPDGWLYGAHGSTVSGVIKRPDSNAPPVHSMGQAIWRYQPEQRRYEIFAEGGGNSFGIEIDSQGRIFSGHNGGDTRGFHFVQGGYYQKGFGKHGELSNPYAFGYFPQMNHPAVARFTHDLLVYEAATLPPGYHGQMFGVAPLQGEVTISEIQADGSTFRTQDTGKAFTTEDSWCRPVHLHLSPDGAIYVADFYEQRIDHASHYQGRVDRSSGRIYRITSAATDNRSSLSNSKLNLAELPTTELLRYLESDNRWTRQTTLQILADRCDTSIDEQLTKLVMAHSGQTALEALWALHLSVGLDDMNALRFLDHVNPQVRLWTIRLLCDTRLISPEMTQRLVKLASTEMSVEVRSQLACSIRRIPTAHALPIIAQLLKRNEDSSDKHVPLLLWWALESHVSTSLLDVLEMFESADLWRQPLVQRHILERLMRRLAQSGTQQELLACHKLLELAPGQVHVETLLRGFEAAFQGRSLAALPDELVSSLAKSGGGSLQLRLRQREPNALAEALQKIEDPSASRQLRIELIALFGEIDYPAGVPVILNVVSDEVDVEVRIAALKSLQVYSLPSISSRVIEVYNRMPRQIQVAAQNMLASRASWAKAWLLAIDQGLLDSAQVDKEVLRKVLLHPDPEIAELVQKHWGEIQGATTTEMKAELERLTKVLQVASGNPYRGKRLYAAQCGKCHVLFGEGSNVGPELTAYQRDDLQRMLLNVVNPSLEIREGYEHHVALTSDGRVLSGFIVDQDNRVVIMRGSNGESYVIAREDLEDLTAISQSLMPEGLLQNLNEQEIRDLFAYLRATQPLND